MATTALVEAMAVLKPPKSNSLSLASVQLKVQCDCAIATCTIEPSLSKVLELTIGESIGA